MNDRIQQLIQDNKELTDYLNKHDIHISIEELIDELSSITNSRLPHLKLKVRTNVILPGKDPESIEELVQILKKDTTISPQLEVLIISDYRKKHDNTLCFKYLLKIPFNIEDKLSDGSKIIDNIDMDYIYDDFLETTYLTLLFDETKIEKLIYKVTKNNLNSYNQDLYKPYNLINKVFINKIRKNKNNIQKH